MPSRRAVSPTNASASATTDCSCTRVSVGPRGREKSSTWWMIFVMRATSSVMMRGVLRHLAGVARLLGDRARAPADDVQRRPELVRDLGRHLTDRRQLLGVAQPFFQGQARARGALAFLARLAQRSGHRVEPPGDRADLVVALGEDDARQVALGDGVDALDQPAQRPHDRLPQREPDDQRDADDDEQEHRDHAARGRRDLGVDVAAVAAHAQDRHRLSRGVAARQLQPGGVVERHRHRVRARSRRRIEQPADRRGLDLGGLHQQQPRLVVGLVVGAAAQHLQLEQLVGLARGADAPVQHRAERVALHGHGLDAGAQRGRDLVRLAAEVRFQVRAPHLQRRVPRHREHGRDDRRRHQRHARPESHRQGRV